MKNKLWITMGLVAAIMTVGCAGQSAKPASEPAAEEPQAQAEAEAIEEPQAQPEAQAAEEPAAETKEEAAEATASAVDYSDQSNWVYYGIGEDKDVDLFLVCPTVDTLDEENMSLENEVMKKYFEGALNMERGIYEDSARMYAPYYRQAALSPKRHHLGKRRRCHWGISHCLVHPN